MKTTLFEGSGVAIVTPFTKDGAAVDYNLLGSLLEFQISNKTDAIIICGTTGEASTLDNEEHLNVIKYTVDKVAKRIPVIAGAGSNDTAHCLYLSQEAIKAGADALLLVTPYYNKTSQKGLLRHYQYVADRVDKPIMLYNVPARTNLNISVEVCKELSKHPNIVAIKEASGLLDHTAMIAAACGDDLAVYAGNDDIILPVMSLGGKGVISVVANMLPEVTHNIVELYNKGEFDKSRKLFFDLLPLIKSLFFDVNPVPIKYCMNKIGVNAGDLRMPLCEMDDKIKASVDKVLDEYLAKHK